MNCCECTVSISHSSISPECCKNSDGLPYYCHFFFLCNVAAAPIFARFSRVISLKVVVIRPHVLGGKIFLNLELFGGGIEQINYARPPERFGPDLQGWYFEKYGHTFGRAAPPVKMYTLPLDG